MLLIALGAVLAVALLVGVAVGVAMVASGRGRDDER
jgi:hypothetical protein